MIDSFQCETEPVDLTGAIDDNWLGVLAALCCFSLEREGMSGEWEVAVVLTTDVHLTELHGAFMDLPEPTDIMTFPSDDVPGGDIVISVEQANRQRGDDGWDLLSELQFLIIHGALHLAGWDDSTPDDRSSMLDRQRVILADFQSREPLSNR